MEITGFVEESFVFPALCTAVMLTALPRTGWKVAATQSSPTMTPTIKVLLQREDVEVLPSVSWRKEGMKNILKISCKSSFPYTRRARTLIRKKLTPHTYLHNISQLCRFPSPAKPLQSRQEGKAALLRWKWSLPDSLSSAPQLRNVPVPHESPNGFNKWQPSSQNPYMDSWALPALRGRWGDHGEAQGWGSSKSWLFWGLPA